MPQLIDLMFKIYPTLLLPKTATTQIDSRQRASFKRDPCKLKFVHFNQTQFNHGSFFFFVDHIKV